jgi:AraC-like DNA-binding protein
MPREKMGSTEAKFFSTETKNSEEVIKLGNQLLSQTNSPEKKSRILGLMAVAYFEKADLNKSTELFFESKNEAEKTGDSEIIAKAYGSLAHQFIHLKLNEKAKFYLDLAIEQIDQMPPGSSKNLLKGLSHLDVGNIEFDSKNFQDANKNYQFSYHYFQSILGREKSANYHYRRSLYNIGNSFYYLNELDSAELYLTKALEVKDPKNIGLKFFIENSLALVYQKKGLNERAVDSLELILKDSNFQNERLKAEIYLNLSKSYQDLKNLEQYQFYNEKYLQLNDSLQTSGLSAIHTAIQEEQKEFALELAEADKNKLNQLWMGLLLILGLLGVIGFLWIKRNREKKIFEELISNLKREMQKVSEVSIESKSNKEEVSTISLSVEEEILNKLAKFEKSGKFTNPKLTISTLAVQLKTNTTYLSEIINSHKGKNFNAYLNELRITYICEKIYQHPEYLQYKISYLAEESGFTSHSAFATVFKSVTGISPSAFLREASKIHSYRPKPTSRV